MAISIVYLALVSGVMIWRGISVSPDYLLLILVPVAVLSGRFVAFLRDWVPFVALFLGYEALRGVAPKLGIKPQVASMVHAEKAVFFGGVPSEVLQRHVGGVHALAVAATVVYFCHFIFPIAAGMVLWLTSRVQFLRFTAALLAMSFAAFVVFLLLPTAPPWYANRRPAAGVHDLVNGALPSAVSPYYRWLNPNAVAAWPSLHSAYPALGALALWGISRRTAFITVPWCLAMWFASSSSASTPPSTSSAASPSRSPPRPSCGPPSPPTSPPSAPSPPPPPRHGLPRRGRPPPPQTAPPRTPPPRTPGEGTLAPRRAAAACGDAGLAGLSLAACSDRPGPAATAPAAPGSAFGTGWLSRR